MTTRRLAWGIGALAALFAPLTSMGCRAEGAGHTGAPTGRAGRGPVDFRTTTRGLEILAGARDTFARPGHPGAEEAASLLASAEVEGFAPEEGYGGAFRAIVETPRNRAPSVRVTVPATAIGAMRIASAGVGVSVRPRDLAPSSVEWAERVAVYPDVSDGVQAFRRVVRDGVEDLYSIAAPRDALTFTYDLELEGAAGLRLVDDTLELLDVGGAPRLRTTAPIAIDAAGVRRAGSIAVTGCAYDVDVRGPWGRRVTPPGSSRCTLTASVDAKGLAFPVLVDPAWVATFNTKQQHSFHKMVYLEAGADKGKILLAGGLGSAVTSTELYDPATTVWARSGLLTEAAGMGEGCGMVALSTGAVVLAGGFPPLGGPAKSTVLLRSATDGTWNYGGALTTGRAWHSMAVVFDKDGNEQVLVAGGQTQTFVSSSSVLKSAELYDPVLDSWSDPGAMSRARTKAAAAVLGDGTLLVAGGEGPSGFGSAALTGTESYDATGGGWSDGPSLNTARSNAVLVALAGTGTKAVIAGGASTSGGKFGSLTVRDSLEYYDGKTWTALAAKLSTPRTNAIGERLGDGKILIAGGGIASGGLFSRTLTPQDSADLFIPGADPVAGTVTSASTMSTPRMNHAAVRVPDKGVLVSGGQTSSTPGSDTTLSEIFDTTLGGTCGAVGDCAKGLFCVDGVCCQKAACPAGQTCNALGHEGVCTKPKGDACASSLECATGFCVEGFCCENACNGGCKSCSIKGSEGSCVLALAGTDPSGFCGGDPVCGKKCNGKGACGGYAPSGTRCGASAVDGGTGPFCEVFECSSFGSCFSTKNKCGLKCVTSVTCDEATKTCTPVASTVKPGFCAIDNGCWSYGDVNPKNPCQTCDPPKSKVAWSTLSTCVDAGTGADGGTDAAPDTPDSSTTDVRPDSVLGTDAGDAADVVAADGPSSDAADDAATDASDDAASGGDAAAPKEELPAGKACGCRTAGDDRASAPPSLLAGLLAIGAVVSRRARRRRGGRRDAA